jgi:hypothetical protein
MLVPIQMIKKNNQQKRILHQKDEFGFINCSLDMKTGENVMLPVFSHQMDLNKDNNKYFHATEQVKALADFLQVPWRLEAFNDV